MENTKIIIESLKQTIIELRDENYRSSKNGLTKAALDFVEILEQALILPVVVKSVKDKKTLTFEEFATNEGYKQIGKSLVYKKRGSYMIREHLLDIYINLHRL